MPESREGFGKRRPFKQLIKRRSDVAEAIDEPAVEDAESEEATELCKLFRIPDALQGTCSGFINF